MSAVAEPAALIGAVEAGGTKFMLALADTSGAIRERTRIDTRHPDQTFAEMTGFFRDAEQTHGRISAFGVASFGPIDIQPHSPTYGTFLNTPKPGWSGANFKAALAAFAAPCLIDTDVNGAALGEAMVGAGQGCTTIAYTTIGTGIGSGIVSRGQPLVGSTHYESGHIKPRHDTVRDPFEGTCPFHADCLEGLASGPAILQRWGHDLSQASPDQIDLIATYVADLTVNLILLHMPDKLVFGGGVMKADGLIDRVRFHVGNDLGGYLEPFAGSLDDIIVPPALGELSGITGAIELGRRALS